MISPPSFSSLLINEDLPAGPQLVFTLNSRFFRHYACYSLLPARPGGQADCVVGLYKYKFVERERDWDIWSTVVENLTSCMQMHAKFFGTCEKLSTNVCLHSTECKIMIKCIDAGVAAGHYAVQQCWPPTSLRLLYFLTYCILVYRNPWFLLRSCRSIGCYLNQIWNWK